MKAIANSERKYLRDGRGPIPESEHVSRVMSANKGKNTKPEMFLRKTLWFKGIKGYRLHWKKAPGRPDIAFPGKKTAVFINGCYWHRCPNCHPHEPKTNKEFWRNKFKVNVDRDIRKQAELRDLGWKVLVVWECEIKKNIAACVERITSVI